MKYVCACAGDDTLGGNDMANEIQQQSSQRTTGKETLAQGRTMKAAARRIRGDRAPIGPCAKWMPTDRSNLGLRITFEMVV